MSETTTRARPFEDRPGGEQARRVTALGLLVNVLLAALKFACGLAGSSRALVADAVHSLSDSTTDLTILVGVRYWYAPADEGHPHGHRRIETVITVVIAFALAGVAVGLTLNALRTLKEQHVEPPGWIALAAAVLSIAVKERLYRRTIAVGRRIRSSAVIANAWHHRSDALSSVPVALAVIGSMLNPAWSYLDHVGAVVVSIFILGAAWRIGWPALKQLVDAAAPEQDRRRIAEVVLATDGVERVHAVRTRYAGPGLEVDLHIQVAGDMTVREGHDISERVKQRLLDEGPDLVDVVVHLEPSDGHVEP